MKWMWVNNLRPSLPVQHDEQLLSRRSQNQVPWCGESNIYQKRKTKQAGQVLSTSGCLSCLFLTCFYCKTTSRLDWASISHSTCSLTGWHREDLHFMNLSDSRTHLMLLTLRALQMSRGFHWKPVTPLQAIHEVLRIWNQYLNSKYQPKLCLVTFNIGLDPNTLQEQTVILFSEHRYVKRRTQIWNRVIKCFLRLIHSSNKNVHYGELSITNFSKMRMKIIPSA